MNEIRDYVRSLAARVSEKIADRTRQRLLAPLHETADEIVKRVAFLIESQMLFATRPARAPHVLFGGVSDEYWLWANTEGVRRLTALREVLPSLPPEKFQLAVASMVGDDTLRHAFFVYKVFKTIIEKHHGALEQCGPILDFGCGWGRVLRFFIKDIDPQRLVGIEMWKEQVDYAKATNAWCKFLHVGKEPPVAGLTAGTFDVVFAYSVFSHIDEDLHKQWIEEFARIIVPGGLLIVTTWGRDRADFLEAVTAGAASVWDEHYNAAVKKFFPGRQKWLAEYDSGCYCHLPLGYGGYESYGESCIPEKYARAVWRESFEVLEYISDRAACMQDVIVARRTADAS